MTTLGIQPDVLYTFLTYAVLAVVKMMLMSPLTGVNRFKKGAFANQEDVATKSAKVKYDDQDVERIRRAHLNDIENIIPFVLLGILYCLTGPSLSVATWHFRVFVGARILHTIVYLKGLQPARAIVWFVGYVVCFSMAAQVLMTVGLRHL